MSTALRRPLKFHPQRPGARVSTIRRMLLCLCCCGFWACDEPAPATQWIDPARPQAPYADHLVDCVAPATMPRSCRLEELPLLGMQIGAPQPGDLMGRVATSHSWMARRFEELWPLMPPAALDLARSLTAIVIASHIRPAHYRTETGAIYLDPAALWLSREEKRSIGHGADPRSGFGDDLEVRVIFRYVLNRRPAWRKHALDDDSERTLSDIVSLFARDLMHELSHAANALPVDQFGTLDDTMTIRQAIDSVALNGQRIDQRLQGQHPLKSRLMFEHARIRYQNQATTPAQRAWQPEDLATAFAPEGANSDYNYVAGGEDVALLFEEMILDQAYGVQRDIAITPRPAADADFIIHWGQRHRIAEPQVRERAALAVQGLLPEHDFSAYFRQLDEAETLPAGTAWQDHLEPE